MADETYDVTMTCANCMNSFNVSFDKGKPVNLHVQCPICGCVPGTGGVKEHSMSYPGKKEVLME